jgi:hypothetical protein
LISSNLARLSIKLHLLGEEASVLQVGEDPLDPPRALGMRLFRAAKAGVLHVHVATAWPSLYPKYVSYYFKLNLGIIHITFS